MKTQINNAELIKTSGLRVVHVRNRGGRDVTVAYRSVHPRSAIFEIATAITNPDDTFTKKIGTRKAIENFQAGRTVLVPDQIGFGATFALRAMFR